MSIFNTNDMQKLKLLYIEIDKSLSDEDDMILDNSLRIRGNEASVYYKDIFNIEMCFDALNNTELPNKIKDAENILLSTNFIGNSFYMLLNYIAMFKSENIKDKTIFICQNARKFMNLPDDVLIDIYELEKNNNINVYVLPNGMNWCFIKWTSEFNPNAYRITEQKK